MSESVAAIASVANPEVVQESIPIETHLVRRRVLLGATVAAGFAMVAGESEYSDAYLSRTFFSPDTDSLPASEPAELADKPLIHTNEHYHADVTSVINAGIDAYKARGGQPYYKRPDCYITEWDAVKFGIEGYTQKPNVRDPYAARHPYERLMNFSVSNVSTPDDMLKIDPGSSTRPLAELRLQNKQADADKPVDPSDPLGPTVGQMSTLDAYRQTYQQTIGALDTMRARNGGGKLSTSDLYAFYLQRNNGNMVTSLVDTTLFLKFMARYDLKVLNGNKTPQDASFLGHTYANAELVNTYFYDDFAASLPLDTLIANVPEKSDINDFTPTGDKHEMSKDYDPINRAGLPYHIWNLITLAACSHPAAAQEMVLSYYAGDLVQTAQGPIKVAADMRVLAQARKIHDLFQQYAV